MLKKWLISCWGLLRVKKEMSESEFFLTGFVRLSVSKRVEAEEF
jgi:hypothetical protein